MVGNLGARSRPELSNKNSKKCPSLTFFTTNILTALLYFSHFEISLAIANLICHEKSIKIIQKNISSKTHLTLSFEVVEKP